MTQTEFDRAGTDPAGHSRWAIFSLLVVAQFMVVLDTSVVYVALPSIQSDLGFSAAGLAWVMDAYMLAFGGLMLLGGRAADLLGRRQVLIAGLLLFAVASLACGLSLDAWQLVAARSAQGLGAAVVSPAAMALVTDIFEEGPDRFKALGIFGGIGGLAGATGVMLGGLLTAVAWQLAFLINVPIVLALLIVGRRMLPAGAPTAQGGVDVPGALVGTGGLCALVYAVVHGGSVGWTSGGTLMAFAFSAVLLAVFVVRQLKAAAPLVPRLLFRARNVVLGNAANAATGALMFGIFFLITLYLQQVRDYSPVQAAVRTVPISVAIFAGSQITFRLFGRIGPVSALAGAGGVQAAALAWWAAAHDAQGGILVTFVLPGTLWGLGMGGAIVAAYVVCTSGLHGAVQGAASGLVNTTLQIGGAVGVAVLGTVADSRSATAVAEHAGDPAGAMASGQAYALAVAAALALVTVPLMLWLRASWRPGADH
ncbi:MFS transporter [Streptomyces sp. NPDC002888]|uniref:MFS transporter n=1 Tax=Streptomyces sp. NPDC002888 TaxID=3364668 RepID=UPI003687E5E3